MCNDLHARYCSTLTILLNLTKDYKTNIFFYSITCPRSTRFKKKRKKRKKNNCDLKCESTKKIDLA